MNFGGFRLGQQEQKPDWSKMTTYQKIKHLATRVYENVTKFHLLLFPLFFLIGLNYQPYGHPPLSWSTKKFGLLAFLPIPIPSAPLSQIEEMTQQAEQANVMGGALSGL
ncbi:hypothetical protein ABK040_008408 [Willaertia magna]